MLLSVTPVETTVMKYVGHICCVVHEQILLLTLKAQSAFCVLTVCLSVSLMGSQG